MTFASPGLVTFVSSESQPSPTHISLFMRGKMFATLFQPVCLKTSTVRDRFSHFVKTNCDRKLLNFQRSS